VVEVVIERAGGDEENFVDGNKVLRQGSVKKLC
jgi:hypothetical protein